MTGFADLGFDIVLCALILGAALATIAMRDLFGGVVFFITYGVFVSIAWLRLGATDVALAEAALGAGLTGVLLVGAIARLPRVDLPSPAPPRRDRLRRAVTGVAALAVTCGLGWGFLALPPATGLGAQVQALEPQTGVGNPVTAVLLNLRAWDTLLESVVLLAALIGVWSVARDADWGKPPGLQHHALRDGVLQSFARLLPPLGLMLGVYLVWAGSEQPGGAFQGGTVLAAVALLVLMGGLVQAPPVTSQWLRLALILGPAVFLGVGVAGAVAAQFLYLPPAYAKPLILGIETALTLSIAITLTLLVTGPPARVNFAGDADAERPGA